MNGTAVSTLIILLVSTVAAVAANLVRPKPLPWIREPVIVPVPQPEAVKSGESAARDARPTATPASQPAKKPGVIAMDEVLKYLRGGGAYFVDAREEHELKDGMLRGAIHLPSSAIYQTIDRVMSQVPPDTKIIVYCGGGECEASHNVRDALIRDFQYKDVSIYEKGWDEISKSPAFTEFVVAAGPS